MRYRAVVMGLTSLLFLGSSSCTAHYFPEYVHPLRMFFSLSRGFFDYSSRHLLSCLRCFRWRPPLFVLLGVHGPVKQLTRKAGRPMRTQDILKTKCVNKCIRRVYSVRTALRHSIYIVFDLKLCLCIYLALRFVIIITYIYMANWS